jgi:hypothetical protein
MLVDEDGNCYLDPKAKLGEGACFLRIRRDETGYHVTVLIHAEWSKVRIPEETKSKLILVETLTDDRKLR